LTNYKKKGTHYGQDTPEADFTDKEIKKRYDLCYGKDRDFAEGQITFFLAKWSSLSEFVKEIKLGFSRYYNRRGITGGDSSGETDLKALSLKTARHL